MAILSISSGLHNALMKRFPPQMGQTRNPQLKVISAYESKDVTVVVVLYRDILYIMEFTPLKARTMTGSTNQALSTDTAIDLRGDMLKRFHPIELNLPQEDALAQLGRWIAGDEELRPVQDGGFPVYTAPYGDDDDLFDEGERQYIVHTWSDRGLTIVIMVQTFESAPYTYAINALRFFGDPDDVGIETWAVDASEYLTII